MGQSAESLRHGARIDHRHHWHPKLTGDISPRRLAVKKAHHPLYQDEISSFSGGSQAPSRIDHATHTKIEGMAGLSAGELVNLRIEKIRSTLEHIYRPPLAGV